jgi:pyruvate/2-oxoglutarate dehydrogenase complex dihydrolipoamide acyltransferase (E2) component
MIGNFRVLPMPRLSPTMEFGKIKRVYIQPKQFVHQYDLALEISVEGLTKETGKESTMEIEIREDMYVAKLWAEEGETLKVGQPIAVFCDRFEDIEAFSQFSVSYMTNLNTNVLLFPSQIGK